MKKRLLKTGIILATATLVMINIQLLFDTSDNPLFQGSTAKASDEYYYQGDQVPNTDYFPNHYMKISRCFFFDLEVDLTLFSYQDYFLPKLSVDIDLSLNASKMQCKPINQIISCYLPNQRPCEMVMTDEAE
ncbi:MAG: hypothetical protein RBS37_07335 [Bacteroidales bacterium]|jgi:hypothetical protein|nr:hypothetical protein [Bacteroidales bacterium]